MAINPVPKHAWLAALVVALTIPPVAAATLASSPVTLAGGALVECSIANVTAAAATVTIRVLDNDAVLAHLGPVALPGGKSQGRAAFCVGICNRPRCEFVTDKPAGDFRASACVAMNTNTNTNKLCLPAE